MLLHVELFIRNTRRGKMLKGKLLRKYIGVKRRNIEQPFYFGRTRSEPTKKLGSLLFLIPFCFHSPTAWAQEVEFADDFSVNTFRYSTETDNNNEISSDIIAEAAAIRLTTQTSSAESSRARLRVNDKTTSMAIMGRFDIENTSLNGGVSSIQLLGSVANEKPRAERDDPNSREGDIQAALMAQLNDSGSAVFLLCFGRIGENSFDPFPVFENNTNHCKNYGEMSGDSADEFELRFSIDGNNVVSIVAGLVTDTVTLPGEFYEVGVFDTVIEHATSGAPGNSEFLVTSVSNSFGTDDFSVTAPVLNRYEINSPGRAAIPTIENERAHIDVTARDNDYNNVAINVVDVGTYFESTVELSGESRIDEKDQQVSAVLDVVMGNDTQDNGFDGLKGDVRASISIEARHDGLRRIEYCLSRYTDSAGNDREGLLEGGDENCLEYPVFAEFDKSYRLAIDFDHANSSVTFRLDGLTQTEILSGLFLASSPRASVEIGGGHGARFTGFIDDIRNSKSALTSAETDAPAAFPSAEPSEPVALDSSLDVPFDFERTPASFIDDFSVDTSVLGIRQWDDTESSIAFADNAVALQAHSNRDPQDGGGATLFDVRGVSDTVVVVAALSSASRIGPGPRHEISVDVQATLLNDTVDGGLEEEGGDIETSIRIRLGGNGRRRVEAEYRRRFEDGNSEGLDVFPEGENRYYFDGLVPDLDTFYTLTLRLDRANNQFVFSVDGDTIAVPIPGGIFSPAANRVQIRAFHRGSSGRAEALIRSIEVDDQLFDFENTAPVLAPYRPRFEDEAEGVNTTVVDGRLRMESDGRINARDSQIRVLGRSTFVGADLTLSSESVVSLGDTIFVGVSGALYSEIDNSDDNSEGSVFSAIRIKLDGDGSRFVERCAWRSNNEDFSNADELIGGDPDNCTRFDIEPALDTAYAASISLDEEARTLTYRFGEEVLVYNILSDIITELSGFNGVRVRSDENSLAVGYADNLAFSENPTPIALSDQNFGNVVRIDEDADTSSAESLDDDAIAEADINSITSSSGGGGGCTVGGSGHPALMLLALLALIRVAKHRLHRRQ